MVRQLLAICLRHIVHPRQYGRERFGARTYLVTSVAACGICHSPVDQSGKRNGPELSGGPAYLPFSRPILLISPRT
jgi:hypothetical protein